MTIPDRWFIEGPYLVDPDTGEVCGTIRDENQQPWHPHSDEDIEWCLSLRHEANQKIAGLKDRIENLQAMIREQERILAWWHLRFLPDLEQCLRDRIANGLKAKSARFEYGRIGLRKTQGRILVTEPDAALEWCAANGITQAIRHPDPYVLVSELKGMEASLPTDAFTVIEPEDKCYVD